MKKLIPALCMLLIAAAMLGTSTYAWFSMNRTVTASGMKVKAQAAGSIVITGTAALPAEGTKTTDFNFADATAIALNASTHSENADHTTGLKYVSNPEKINLETGIRLNNEATLNYANAENVSGGYQYYKDYSIYIAGDGDEFKNQDIAITLAGTTTGEINKAISVDFYAQADATAAAVVNSTNYKGTLNVAGVKNVAEENANVAYTTFTIQDVTIPKTGSNKAYAVTMRVYYDGALIQTAGTNPYTTYEAATGTDGKCDDGKFYYTDNKGSAVATVKAGETPVTGLYQVNAAASAKAYARTTEIANIADVTLVVSFVATNHS